MVERDSRCRHGINCQLAHPQPRACSTLICGCNLPDDHKSCSSAGQASPRSLPTRLVKADRSRKPLRLRLVETKNMRASRTQCLMLWHCSARLPITRLLRSNYEVFRPRFLLRAFCRSFRMQATLRAAFPLCMDSLALHHPRLD